MKQIKKLTGPEWGKLYIKVNSPIPQRGVDMQTFKARESLFDKIKKMGTLPNDPDNLDFSAAEGCNLKLKESEWEELKKSFELGTDTTMSEAKLTNELLERIKEADTFTDKITKPGKKE